MLLIPNETFIQYVTYLNKRGVIADHQGHYKKWLRYYLDFCDKYPVPDANSDRIRLFCEKLKDKKQSESQREQAAHAVSLYLEMKRRSYTETQSQGIASQRTESLGKEAVPVVSDTPVEYTPAAQYEENQQLPSRRSSSQFTEAGYQEKSKSPEWDAVLAAMAAEIKVRHYSRKTLKTYANWSRKLQRFLKDKSPQELSTADVKEYLTFLAVKCSVAASTQNQTFNSLLFLFRHGLKREFGELRDVPRAKRSRYIPAVLCREEIDAILNQLSYPHNLVVNMPLPPTCCRPATTSASFRP